jgi:hypothetical protein
MVVPLRTSPQEAGIALEQVVLDWAFTCAKLKIRAHKANQRHAGADKHLSFISKKKVKE